MSKELFDARVKLIHTYSAANGAVAEAREKCAAAKQAIIEFDDAHPDVIRAVKRRANDEKWKAGAEARKAKAAAEAEAKAEAAEGESA